MRKDERSLSPSSSAGTTSPVRPERPSQTQDRHDWGMLALAWLLYFAFASTLASLFPLVGIIRTDLDLTYAQVGVVLGGWQLVYLLAAIPTGVLVDRFQPKTVLFVGTLVVAGSQVARSFADGFIPLLLAVAILGLGGPVMSVGLPKVIAEFFAGRHRSTASGIYLTGAHLGQVAALALTMPLLHAVNDSWRNTLRIHAVLIVLIAITWLLLAKRVDRSAVIAAGTGVMTGLRRVATIPAVWLIVTVGFAGFLGSHGYRSWLPTMIADKGFSATAAGLVAAIPALSGIVGSIVVVRFMSVRSRRVTAIVLLFLVGASMLAAAMTTGPVLLVAVALEGFCAAALMPLMMNALMEMPQVGAARMGAAASLYFTIGEMGGFAGPSLIGFVVGLTGSFTLGVLVLSLTMWAMILPAARIPRRLPPEGRERSLGLVSDEGPTRLGAPPSRCTAE